jgi:hypothetical protein
MDVHIVLLQNQMKGGHQVVRKVKGSLREPKQGVEVTCCCQNRRCKMPGSAALTKKFVSLAALSNGEKR